MAKSEKIIFLTLFAIVLAAILIVPIVSADDGNVTAVTTPFITIDPIGNHTAGDVFFITGTTNLPVSEELFLSAYPTDLPVMQAKTRSTNPIWTWGINGDLHIISGINGTNTWSFNATNGNWVPDEYIATVSTTNYTVFSADQVFTIASTTPFITIDPIGNHSINDVLLINGTTNLPVSNDSIHFSTFSASFNPGGFGSSFRSNISIQSGENGVNFWSVNATTDRWITQFGRSQVPGNVSTGEFAASVWFNQDSNVSASQLFFLLPPESKINPSLTSQNQTMPVASFSVTIPPIITIQTIPSQVDSTVGTGSIGITASPTRQTALHSVILSTIAIFSVILILKTGEKRR
ncbi:MAG: hypothetical protein WB986_03755 [Methanoregula sp.]|uniref:hypothetical protein n=1 Tax=Methanoregula sp. TaxID=2052170 RepID=UPI003C51C90A